VEDAYAAGEEEVSEETKLDKEIHGKIDHEMIATLPTKGTLEGFETEEEMKESERAEAKAQAEVEKGS